jgi:hypothetical protein
MTTSLSGTTASPGTSPLQQLALLPGPVLRSDIAWHHSRRCECQRPEGAEACGSCPFTYAWPGMTRALAS